MSDEDIYDAWIIKVESKEEVPKVIERIEEYIDVLKQDYDKIEIVKKILDDENNIKYTNKNGIIKLAISSQADLIISTMNNSILGQQEVVDDELEDAPKTLEKIDPDDETIKSEEELEPKAKPININTSASGEQSTVENYE